MTVEVVLREYVERLKEQEKAKPAQQRRVVPTVEDMAQAAGISRTGFIDFSHNRTKHLNRVVIDSVISQFRACGFDTKLTDIIQYREG